MNDIPEILVIDDEPRIVESISYFLETWGFKPKGALSGAAAIEKLNTETFELVLLDISLKDMSGFDIMDIISRLARPIPVIVLTGMTSREVIVECLRRGAYDYIAKPFDEEELKSRIKHVLEAAQLEKEKIIISERLAASEARYQYLVQNSPDIIYTLDVNGGFTFISGPVESLLGYMHGELIGKHYSTIIHPDDIERVRTIIEDHVSCPDGNPRCAEVRFLPKGFPADRSEIIIELKMRGLYEPGTAATETSSRLGIFGIARDITVRKRAEKELELQKVHFQQLFENSPEGIVILDNEEHVLDANRGFEQLFQFHVDEIKKMPINELIVPDGLREETQGFLDTAIAEGMVKRETVRRRKDGELIDVEILGYPIVLSGKKIGIYGIYTDITKRKQSDERLQKTLDQLRRSMGAVIHAMALTVEVRDPYTAGHQQRVSSLARSIAEELGCTQDEVDGIRMAGAIHDLGKINVPAEILSKPGRISDIEFCLIKTHPLIAFDILKEIDFQAPVAEMVYQHHEKMNGSGYPQGLSGDKILPGARILTVADVVEAIASHRPYRPALGITAAIHEITEKRGQYYDPDVVDACVRLFQERRFAFLY